MFSADKDPRKLDLTGAYYLEENGDFVEFNAIKKAAEIVRATKRNPHESFPITGYVPYVESVQNFIFGEKHPEVVSGKIASVQTFACSGALRMAFDWFREYKPSMVYISKPSYVNHAFLIGGAGLKHKEYAYYDYERKSLDIEGMLLSINQAPCGSVFLLHACGHNPTGIDPDKDQWSQIAEAIAANGHLVLFDMSYQ